MGSWDWCEAPGRVAVDTLEALSVVVELDRDSGRVEVHVLYAEARKDNINHGDDEDEDKDDVVQDVGGFVLFGVVNVHPANNHEEHTHYHLKQQSVKLLSTFIMVSCEKA